MFKYLLILSLFTITKNCDAFIVPQEIPSLLSLIYSNIPPIKKGTDSRIGFGYRLGDHADFQIQFEIGPQKETQPIGSSSSSNRRRSVMPTVEKEVTKQEKKKIAKIESLVDEKSSDSNNDSWLQSWHRSMTDKTLKSSPVNERIPKISNEKLNQLMKLYDSARNADEEEETTILNSNEN